MLGDPQHIRDDLVRVATAIPNAAVRSRLMYSLAAHLMKANHSFEDIASTVAACGSSARMRAFRRPSGRIRRPMARKRLKFLPARSWRHLMLKSWSFRTVCMFSASEQPSNGAEASRQAVECISTADPWLRVEADAIVRRWLDGTAGPLLDVENVRELAWVTFGQSSPCLSWQSAIVSRPA
jgi:hypothetical protein